MKKPSITRQLLLGVLLPLLPILCLVGFAGYMGARFEIGEVYDAQLATAVNFLHYYRAQPSGPEAPDFQRQIETLDHSSRAGFREYTRWRRFRIWRDGDLVFASRNAPIDQTPHPAGYSESRDQAGHWRYFTLYLPESKEVIEAAENIKARNELIARVFWGLILPLTLAIPIITFTVWRGIVWGLKDLRRFADSVRERSADKLTPIDTVSAPEELQTLSLSINGLLETISNSLEQERLFTDNAAHELRTPLAAVRAQTEVVSGARNARERRLALAELTKGVDRAANLMDKLLTIARLRYANLSPSSIRLSEVVTEALLDLYPEAERKRIGFNIDNTQDASVVANPQLLGIILRNLIDNAIKYSPADADIDLTTFIEGKTVHLDIRDRGPGIPEDERVKVFARFYRIKGTRASGSGLGLAIVRMAAAQLNCAVTLLSPQTGPGLLVRLSFE
ncbi:MAG: ATP-binding protein [Asticcacaulis sp.]|uniref:ATP-binding protein n=1 Tax=Asticcacaulis sp. TaxID=1872648 RepID=UPI0039E506E7